MGLFDWARDRVEDVGGAVTGAARAVGNAASSTWNAVDDVVKPIGGALYTASPIDNIVNTGRAIGRGDWSEAAKQAGIGVLEAGMMLVPGGAAARAGYNAARLAGRGGFSAAARALPRAFGAATFRDPAKALRTMAPARSLVGRGLQTAARTGPVRLAAGLAGSPINRALWEGPAAIARAQGTPARTDDDVRREGYAMMAAAARANGGTGNYGLGAGPGGAGIGGMGTNQPIRQEEPVEGGSGLAPGAGGGGDGGTTSTVGSSTQIPTNIPADAGTGLPLSPYDQAQFDQARIDALRQLNLQRADMDLQRRGSSLAAQQQLREAGRFGATQAADLTAMASEMGFGASPATYSVGLSEIAQEEARRRMAAQSDYRGMQEQLARRGSAAQLEYEKYLNELAMQEAQARAAGAVTNVQGRYGI